MRCTATTKSGKLCKNEAVGDTVFCDAHKKSLQDNKLQREFNVLLPTASRLAKTLEQELKMLLDFRGLTLGVPIERRVKDWSSITEKLERQDLHLVSLKELPDFVGLRLILLFRGDLEGVHSLLTNTFDVLSHEDTSSRLEETQFGYQSMHYIIRIPADWLKVPTMADFKDFQAELQVRTMAQHIWAAASHKLQYKQKLSVPLPLRRSIYRVSAILETVDLEFERLLNDRGEYMKKLSSELGEDSHLNVDIVRQILSNSWPKENYEESDKYGELLQNLIAVGIEKGPNLTKLIEQQRNDVLKVEKEQLIIKKRQLKDGSELQGTIRERIERGVFFTHVGLTNTAIKQQFPDKYEKIMRQWAKSKL